MDRYDLSDKKKYITKTTWQYLFEAGLSNASIGELCKRTGLSQSSLYYWFENKDDICISDTEYVPANNIKRGDFILILTRMLNTKAETSDNFTDVPVGSHTITMPLPKQRLQVLQQATA